VAAIPWVDVVGDNGPRLPSDRHARRHRFEFFDTAGSVYPACRDAGIGKVAGTLRRISFRGLASSLSWVRLHKLETYPADGYAYYLAMAQPSASPIRCGS